MKDNIVYYVIVNKRDPKYVLKSMLDYFNLDFNEIVKSKYGKPYFKDSDIYFNYSHSTNYLACAISKHEVGIDIEETNRVINDDIANNYLNGDYKLETWVKKESYSKLKGLGLKMDFNSIDFNSIKEANLLIKNKKYICSIYSESKDIEFKKIILK